MKINELRAVEINNNVEIVAKINDVKIMNRKNGQEYILITLTDDTDKITFPVWENVEERKTVVKPGAVVKVKGALGEHNGKLQILKPIFYQVSEKVITDALIPRYEITKELIRYFEDVVNDMDVRYRKFAIACTGAFGYNNERWKAFTECPSAEVKYGNKIGGLLLHTIGVMKSVEAIIKNYINKPFNHNINASDVINKDRLMLKAIIHDIGKTKTFEYKDCIRVKKGRLSHIEKGATFITEVNIELGKILTEEELEDIQYTILSRYGDYGKYELKTIEDKIIHNSDMLDSQVAIEANRGA